MKKGFIFLLGVSFLIFYFFTRYTPPLPKLISRDVLFGNFDKSRVRLSPDGRTLAFLAPVDGVLNVWIAPIDDIASAKAMTHDTGRGINSHFWMHTNKNMVYLQDTDGDENWKLYNLDVTTGITKLLTPPKRVQAQVIGLSDKHPEDILVGLNERNPQYFDVYKINISNGEKKLVLKNDEFIEFVSDNNLNIRFAYKPLANGGFDVFELTNSLWKPFRSIGPEDIDTTHIIGMDKRGETLFLQDSINRNTSALTAIDLKTNKETVLAYDPQADIDNVLRDPRTDNVIGYSTNYEREKWQGLNDETKKDIAYLETLSDATIIVTSQSSDHAKWLVAFLRDDGPFKYYLYDRANRTAHYLFNSRPALENEPLVHMQPVIIKSRDGLNLVSYLSLPKGSIIWKNFNLAKPFPMVLLVHGGPWARDTWDYTPEHQWLVNRGYAVLSVNYRGSTGFGKQFVNAADREWAGKMHDDLIDAVNWTIQQRIADPKRIAIMGGSYGGYAALVGLTFTPNMFAAGIDSFGLSDLVTDIETLPPYWQPYLPIIYRREGDNRTPDGTRFLNSRSPLTFVDKISKPLLIAHGVNDPRVKKSESDQIVAAMQQKHIPVTYLVYPDEGHGFVRPENQFSFYAVAESFLAKYLGGKVEPFGNSFKNSSVQVPVGSEYIPGLKPTP